MLDLSRLSVIEGTTVATKLGVLFAVNAPIALLLAAVGLVSLHNIGLELHQVATEDMPLTLDVSQAATHQLEQVVHF